jgi:hypothetical protein
MFLSPFGIVINKNYDFYEPSIYNAKRAKKKYHWYYCSQGFNRNAVNSETKKAVRLLNSWLQLNKQNKLDYVSVINTVTGKIMLVYAIDYKRLKSR